MEGPLVLQRAVHAFCFSFLSYDLKEAVWCGCSGQPGSMV